MRHLIVTVAFTLACTAPADPGPDAAVTAQDGESVELRVGEAVTLDGGAITIEFLSVIEDSRCPKSVVCVWQGDGAVELEVRWNQSTRIDTLHTTLDPISTAVDTVLITLTHLAPYPQVPGTIPQEEYVLTLASEAIP
ncbi:MAG: hypothetical protein PVF27_01015 [Gemmatimonadales bacterium]